MTRARSRAPALVPCGVLALLLGMTVTASAQTVWRCGPDGRSYRDTPCAEGRALAVSDPRDDVQRAQAQEVAEREQRLSQQLRQERRQREHEVLAAAGRGAAGIKPAPVAAPTLDRVDRVDRVDREPRHAARTQTSHSKGTRAHRSKRARPRR